MKKVIIFHGTDCEPNDKHYWYSWLKRQLEDEGYAVELPHYPDINHTPIKDFLPKVLKNHTFSEDTIIIGHSAGGPLLLSILENLDHALAQAILVAGYSHRLENETSDPILQEKYDWQKIARNSKNFVFINSVDDPWGCDDKQGRLLFEKLGGTQIIRNDGHFGSVSQNQYFTEFPLLLKLIGVD